MPSMKLSDYLPKLDEAVAKCDAWDERSKNWNEPGTWDPRSKNYDQKKNPDPRLVPFAWKKAAAARTKSGITLPKSK